MICHHPDEMYLAGYASGQLGEAESLVIASHAALCPVCRTMVHDFEMLGGCLLEDIAPVAISAVDIDALLRDVIPDPVTDNPVTPIMDRLPDVMRDLPIPGPLRHYIGNLDPSIAWQPVIRGLDQIPLDIGHQKNCKTKLLRIKSGATMPRHSHKGDEFTLVLTGAFEDERGYFGPGDLAISNNDVDHRPVAADIGDCISLVVINDDLRLTGPVTRFFNPFMRF